MKDEQTGARPHTTKALVDVEAVRDARDAAFGGDMPPIALSFNEIELIARYVREVREPQKYSR